ncbi:hypothetical protein SDC9_152758 [bioreactor metagenome]|uniref:Phosphonate metabolism protein n=1 Tax=bioreactor metagenome TaxID=1076179 RepID=A0A645EUH6_9ZZZZ
MVNGVNEDEFLRMTAEPRRYGWHATLKAPFRLAEGCDLADVLAGVQSICSGRAPFALPSLQVTRMGNFLGLRPRHASSALDALAADCVRQLQPLAAPLSDDELARRRRAGLTPEQDALLQSWGYPWVLNHFRFHLSLTGPLDTVPSEQIQSVMHEATRHFYQLPVCVIDSVSVFAEPTEGADFRLIEQIRFQP